MSTAAERKTRNEENEQQLYSFILLLDGVEGCDEATADALHEAGCDDALFGFHHGQAYLEFDRHADSAIHAMVSAISAVEGCGRGITVLQVVPPGKDAMNLVNAYLQLRSKDKEPAVRNLVDLLRASPK
jgi:hypothetical protein